MLNKKSKAFTLVELIVVITILAILGTIAFISMQGYSKSSRDSVRISDMSKMKSTLEFFHIDSGKYPAPTNGYEVTYSGAEVWTQGTFGSQTFTNVGRIDKIPKDPLTDREYTYSVTNTKQEFELGSIMETNDITLINDIYAGDRLANARITGTYNGKLAKVSTGSITYVLAIPSIIGSIETNLEDLYTINGFVYTGYQNLPANYEGSAYNTTGEGTSLALVNPGAEVLYTGNISNLSDPDDATARIGMLEAMQDAYTGSVIADSAVSEIMAITDFSDSTDPILTNLAGVVVNNTLGASIPVEGGGGTGGGDDGGDEGGDENGVCVFGTSTFGNCTFGL